MTNLMEQARQGDPKAIAALMNRSTEPKGISVKATRDGNCLQVLLEGENVPARDATLSFVRQGMANLGIASIAIVKVFGRQVGQDTPVWQEEIILDEDAALAAAPMSSTMDSPLDNLDDEDLLPDDPLDDDFYRDDAPNSLDDGAYFDEDDYSDSTPSDVPHLPNESITDFVDDDDPEAYDEDLADDSFETEAVIDTAEKPAKQSSGLLLGLLSFLALLLGGYYIYSQKPEVLAGLPIVGDLIPGLSGGAGDEAAIADNVPVATEEAASNPAGDAAPATTDPTTGDAAPDPAAPAPSDAAASPDAATPEAPTPEAAPAAAPTPTPTAAPAAAPTAATPSADPFREAVSAATQAAQLTQSASTAAEWSAIVTLWETAIAQMGNVPSESPNYATAQDRLNSYPANLNYARQQAGQ
ncbi:MAG: hypothetical protein HC795_12025 [Coleofasciculaceae cyanobacterium RL_1_1]|nr:hypothetical protein [Coleofasciculaceae cyanobacterium RL_1_1]